MEVRKNDIGVGMQTGTKIARAAPSVGVNKKTQGVKKKRSPHTNP